MQEQHVVQAYYQSYIANLKATLDEIDFPTVQRVIETLMQARQEDRQIFVIGNGGSASTASHLTCDLGKGTINYHDPAFRRFRVLSLTDNQALITALGNDLSYDDIFIEQLKNYLNPGDVLIAITASGNSPNIIKAMQYARACQATVIGLLGFSGGKARELADISLVVSSCNYGIAEDSHLTMQHIISQILRRLLADGGQKIAFLDRDGIINKKAAEHHYITSWEEFAFLPGAIASMQYLSQMGYKLVVVTNQQGVGKGLMSEATLQDIHAKMLRALAADGVHLEKIYYCPHVAEANCGCRKPQLGMFFKAQNELYYNINMHESLFISDSASDILAGNRFGVKTVYVGAPGPFPEGCRPTFAVQTIADIMHLAY